MGLTVRNGAPARSGGTTTSIREAIVSVERALEDINWTNLSTDRQGDESGLSYEDRRTLIRRARRAKRKNPLVKQAANLLVNYVLGQGISLKANNRTLIAKCVDEMWEDPVNRATFTSHASMSEFLQGAFTDGMQALVCFPDTDEGTLQLGTIDATLIEHVITDPENWRIVKWVGVRRPKSKFDFANNNYSADGDDDIVWYREWRNTDDDKGPKPPDGKVQKGLIMLCRRGKGKYGESEVEAALDWVNAHRMFMEDRATITRAAATIAWKKKRKNSGAADIASEVERLQSTLQRVSQGYDANPAYAAGSTIVENDYSNLEWMKTDTGGANALSDERIFRMMGGSGMGGIPNHYFGDEANANLATATAMELPLLKMYENWQKWLGDIVQDLITLLLETAHEAGKIGERDDSSKYADRSLTAEQVLRTDQAQIGPDDTPGAQGGVPDASPAADAGPAPIAEAGINIHINGQGAGGGAVGDAGSNPDAVAAGGPQPPGGPPQPQMAPTDPRIYQVRDPEGPGKDDPVDWYVDVDFPPIVQKETYPYMQALGLLAPMLPADNPDAKQLMIELALVAFGVNDVDQLIDRIFPVLPPGATPSPPAMPLQQGPAQPALLGPGQPPKPGGFPPGAQAPGQPVQMREGITPEWRIHRLVEVARQAAESAEAVYGRGDN